MDLLKRKLKSSSLMEVLVSSVILIIIFFIAMTSFNTMIFTSVKNDDFIIRNHLEELEYIHDHKKLKIPFYKEKGRFVMKSHILNTDTILQVVNAKGEMIAQRNFSK